MARAWPGPFDLCVERALAPLGLRSSSIPACCVGCKADFSRVIIADYRAAVSSALRALAPSGAAGTTSCFVWPLRHVCGARTCRWDVFFLVFGPCLRNNK